MTPEMKEENFATVNLEEKHVIEMGKTNGYMGEFYGIDGGILRDLLIEEEANAFWLPIFWLSPPGA